MNFFLKLALVLVALFAYRAWTIACDQRAALVLHQGSSWM